MKTYDIKNLKQNYNIDTITCFEHPIAVALSHFNDKCSNCYIMLSKLYGMYIYGQNKENRERIFEDLDKIFEIRVITDKKITWKLIKENIDNGNPVIVGVNLREIFYSEHYMKKDWGHWILITGYNDTNCTLNIFDNAQYGILGEKYGDFVITYELLLKASKSYRKKYDNEYNCMILKKQNKFNYQQVVEYIIGKYSEIDLQNEEVYRIRHLLITLNDLAKTGQAYSEFYLEEFKKKIININKYREAFLNEICNALIELACDIDMVDSIRKQAVELQEKWKYYSLKYSVRASSGKCEKIVIDNVIMELEKDLQKNIVESIKFISKSNDETSECNKKENEITYRMENNKDRIIYGTDDNIIFEFEGNRTYNWWIEDDAPKVCILEENFDEINEGKCFTLTAKMKIEKSRDSVGDELFQAGFYLRTHINDSNYMCAIENKENWVLDKVGYDGIKKSINSEYDIFVKIVNNKIIFGTFVVNEERVIAEEKIITEGHFEMGLVCKTWNKSTGLKVQFNDINISSRKSQINEDNDNEK